MGGRVLGAFFRRKGCTRCPHVNFRITTIFQFLQMFQLDQLILRHLVLVAFKRALMRITLGLNMP